MARGINEIKNEITREFMSNDNAAQLYGFAVGSNFNDYFGAVSVENILFYVWAVCAWTVEQLVDLHKAEVTEEVESLIAHRPKWYRDKVLSFMADMPLMEDTDSYDTYAMNESEIEKARVVKHAVATESKDASLLTIKVAGETGGKRQPLEEAYETQLRAYIAEIKDAGVRIALVNMTADVFNCKVDIYYNALLQADTVKKDCNLAILEYIENLPFNGEYTNMDLIDRLQAVEGVKIAELLESSAQASNESTITMINARLTPVAGYFKAGSIDINMIPYNEQT